MSETSTEPHQRLPPPYHHNHHRYGRHSLDASFSVAGHRGNVDYGIPAIEKYAFCLCLHVRPMTIFIAAYKLITALLDVSKLVNTELSFDEQTSSDLSNADGVHRSTAVAFEILTRIIMASASGVAIYAAVSGRAALLMPLYSVLLIEFFFALPSFYGRDMDSAYASDGVISMKNNSATNNDQYNRYSVFISTLIMITKIYFLCVIWKCYRYLRLIQLVGEMCAQMPSPIVRVLGLEDGVQNISQNQGGAPPPYDSIASSVKPPNYEDAIKSSNIYTIDVQPHNSQLPNYPSTLPPPGTQQQQQP